MAARPVRRLALLGAATAALAVVAGALATIPAQQPPVDVASVTAAITTAGPSPSPQTQVDIVYQETPTAAPAPVTVVRQRVNVGENESGND